MRIHYLQHVPFENPGIILSWAESRKYPVTCTRLFEDDKLPAGEDFDWLVIMGGPMNIYEEETYPWLIKEKEFIKTAISENKLILGLCLGAQLIADVIGGKVVKNQYSEIGWFPVTFTKEAMALPQFSHFPPNPVVFEWHGDTFTDLPKESMLIATNKACRNQAFAYGKRVYGFQFHLENTRQIITDLIENCRDEMVPGTYIQSVSEILAGKRFIDQNNQWMLQLLDKLENLQNDWQQMNER